MITVLLIFVAAVAGGLFVEMISAATAPMGYQDEKGFHFGSENSVKSSELENPS